MIDFSSTKNTLPTPIVERTITVGKEQIRTCAGLHLLYGGSKSGKTLLSLAMIMALDEAANWHYVNEPGGEYLSNKEVDDRIGDSTARMVLIDSLSTYLLEASADGSPAMKGGVSLGTFRALGALDKLARGKGVILIGVVNTTIFSASVDDAAVTGQLEPQIATRSLTWRDRASGRRNRTVTLEKDVIAEAALKLGYEASSQSEVVDQATADWQLLQNKARELVSKEV